MNLRSPWFLRSVAAGQPMFIPAEYIPQYRRAYERVNRLARFGNRPLAATHGKRMFMEHGKSSMWAPVPALQFSLKCENDVCVWLRTFNLQRTVLRFG